METMERTTASHVNPYYQSMERPWKGQLCEALLSVMGSSILLANGKVSNVKPYCQSWAALLSVNGKVSHVKPYCQSSAALLSVNGKVSHVKPYCQSWAALYY
uniref:Uncharacterized protein n=1 Tax=Cacopsylla melanoneura TaxID=428564 RepID=A0A8D9B701_9HEMI